MTQGARQARLLIEGPGGPWGAGDPALASAPGMMALDAALLACPGEGSLPTLRLYAWPGPALSLGRTQRAEPGAMARWRGLGVELARRPTGGRAVLHQGVFTYAWVEALPPHEGVAQSHRRLAQAVGAALGHLGLALRVGRQEALGPRGPEACYATGTLADLMWQGRKVVGAAQARSATALLQQGSLYLARPAELAEACFGPGGEGAPADLAEALGRPAGFEEVAEAFAWGFQEALGLSWARTGWREAELVQAGKLLGQATLEPSGG